MEGYEELLEKLKDIKSRGYIKSHRFGDTGVGKTLEDLLGIKENNIPGPNGICIELKAARKGSNTMLTLFTKSPEPRGINTKLLDKCGYEEKEGKILHITLNANNYTNIKGKPSMKLSFNEQNNRLEIDFHPSIRWNYEKPYWTKDTLQKSFERKLPKLLYVKADSREKINGNNKVEEFWYNEAWLLSGFNFIDFIKALQTGLVLVDIRIGRYNDGSVHDHGTAFRIRQDKLELCFINKIRLL